MNTGFQGGSAAVPATLVEISVSCRNLIDADVFSKSDPMCVLYINEFGKENYVAIGRTETIWNNLNPDFAKKFVIPYYFEENQGLKFEIYDVDSNSTNLSDHDFLGRMECTLAEIVSTGRLVRKLLGPAKDSGMIIAVVAEELSNCKEEVTLHFQAQNLDKKDFFGKSDPFLCFSKSMEDGSYTVVHRTEVIKNNLNPRWKSFVLPVRLLCNGDYDRSIFVQCFDWNLNGNHKLIGEFATNLREITKAAQQHQEYEVINPKKSRSKKNYKNSGLVILLSCQIQNQPSFLDFIKGGTQLHCSIAIDFTASNGNPVDPTSLHYINPFQPTQYAIALKAVANIIQEYDSDKMFPVLGFGARLPPDGRVSHEFFVNLHSENPYCYGTDGVLQAYEKCLKSVQLFGPTNFAPIINHVARFADSCARDGMNYFILLILTDGVISDMAQTKEAIVNAATLPMSIIIVGIGNADFTAMNELDGDDVRLSSRGRIAERDIVQFVPFRDFVQGVSSSDRRISQARLAKEVLAEIPEQFLSFMKRYNIKPHPPLRRQSLTSATDLFLNL